MKDDLLDILSGGHKDIDNQKLLDYLSNQLKEEEKYEFEKSMADSDMLNDVVEGLEKFKDKKEVTALVEQLNSHLKKQLERKKERKLKRELKNPLWLYFSIVILLILVLVAFIIIRKFLENKEDIKAPAPTTIIIYK
ncbi:MAG TPA: hypothetical protein VG847_03690 [Chitinophagaceae bacterium]|nr:hypothetical protein [Chitinophagaceae bacterium]